MKIQETSIERIVTVISLPIKKSSNYVSNLELCLKYCGHENSKLREMEMLPTEGDENLDKNKEYIVSIIEDQKTIFNKMSAKDIAFCSEYSISQNNGEGGSPFLTIIEK